MTRLSRSAGPVCSTRLAMRPAKSFWKNVQLCRTTCQWFCQRIMLDRPGLTIWFTRMLCATKLSGRSTSSTPAMPQQRQAVIAEQRLRRVGGDQADDPADEGRDHRVQDRDQAAEDEQRDGQAGDLADVEPVEPDQAGGGRRGRGAGGGIQQGFETAQHGYQRWTLLAAVVNRGVRQGIRPPAQRQAQWPRTQYGPSQCGGTQTRRGGRIVGRRRVGGVGHRRRRIDRRRRDDHRRHPDADAHSRRATMPWPRAAWRRHRRRPGRRWRRRCQDASERTSQTSCSGCRDDRGYRPCLLRCCIADCVDADCGVRVAIREVARP